MTTWNYASSGGTNYPVRRGELWRADHHAIACGDLEAGDGLRLIGRFGCPDLVYSDPPWNNGNAAAFRTKAGTPGKVNFTAFLDALLTVVRTARRDVFLEMGQANADHLVDLAEKHGGNLVKRWSITYYRRHPCVLMHLLWNITPAGNVGDLSGMDDDDTPRAALGACWRPGDIIMDPCTGRGLTASVAASEDRTFLGLELSPWRMSCTLTRLAAAGCKIMCEGPL